MPCLGKCRRCLGFVRDRLAGSNFLLLGMAQWRQNVFPRLAQTKNRQGDNFFSRKRKRNQTSGQSKGTHVVGHCVAFNNNKTTSVKGFDQNNHKGGILLYQCLAWNNGYNYMFETSATDGAANVFINNVSIKRTRNDYEIVPGSTETNNSWNPISVIATAADYADLTEEAAKAPRQADGTLPNNGFARLVAGSDLIDKGKKIDSIAFVGIAPDLGPYEFQSPTGLEEYIWTDNEALAYPNPFDKSMTLNVTVAFQYTISTLQGTVLEEGNGENRLSVGEHLNPGLYIVGIKSNTLHRSLKISKRE